MGTPSRARGGAEEASQPPSAKGRVIPSLRQTPSQGWREPRSPGPHSPSLSSLMSAPQAGAVPCPAALAGSCCSCLAGLLLPAAAPGWQQGPVHLPLAAACGLCAPSTACLAAWGRAQLHGCARPGAPHLRAVQACAPPHLGVCLCACTSAAHVCMHVHSLTCVCVHACVCECVQTARPCPACLCLTLGSAVAKPGCFLPGTKLGRGGGH